MFYIEWQNQLDILSDEEKIRFIYNLIRYHEGKEVELSSKVDKLVWNGVLPALRTNQMKYDERVEKNRKNGKLGGRPKKNEIINHMVSKKPNGFSNNPDGFFENPKNPIIDNRKEVIENSEQINEKRKQKTENSEKKNENRKEKKDNSEKKNDNRKLETGNGKMITGDPVEIYNSTGAEDIFSDLYVNKNPVDYNDIGVITKELNRCFQNYPNWKKDLLNTGIDEFISNTENFHLNNKALIDLLHRYFFHYI